MLDIDERFLSELLINIAITQTKLTKLSVDEIIENVDRKEYIWRLILKQRLKRDALLADLWTLKSTPSDDTKADKEHPFGPGPVKALEKF